MKLITIDPGKITGWAIFGSVLIQAGFTAFTTCFQYGQLPTADKETTVVIELPRWYPHDTKDVNDLIDLAVRVGELKHFYELQGATVELVWPRTWKGTVPKKIHNNRVLRALSPDEHNRLQRRSHMSNAFDHNMLDAVGIGLYRLGRLR